MRCKSNNSCVFKNKLYDNWSQIPTNVTGCQKRCYCKSGKVSCQPAYCDTVSVLPPSTLHCFPYQAKLVNIPDDECCQHWVCDENSPIPGTVITPGKLFLLSRPSLTNAFLNHFSRQGNPSSIQHVPRPKSSFVFYWNNSPRDKSCGS